MARKIKALWMILATISIFGVAAFIFMILWLFRLDIVEERYSTREQAIEANLFERGWLPEIIPVSARNIHMENNLDINTSVGRFDFDPDHADNFKSAIENKDDGKNICGINSHMKNLIASGYTLHNFSHNGMAWAFVIHSELGHCEYCAVQTSYPRMKKEG